MMSGVSFGVWPSYDTHIHRESSVRLVRAVLPMMSLGTELRLNTHRVQITHHIHCHIVRHDPEPTRQIHSFDLFPNLLYQPFHDRSDLPRSNPPRAPHSSLLLHRRSADKRHLDIYLGELCLPVFAP